MTGTVRSSSLSDGLGRCRVSCGPPAAAASPDTAPQPTAGHPEAARPCGNAAPEERIPQIPCEVRSAHRLCVIY